MKRFLTAIVVVAAVALPVVPAAFASPSAGSHRQVGSVSRYTSATVGTLAPGGTGSPVSKGSPRWRPKGARRVHLGPGTGRGPVATPSSAGGPPPALLADFNGVGSRDSAKTNFGLKFEPPDQGLCVGKGLVLEPVNSAYTIYRPDGSVVSGPFNVNVLFDEPLTAFTSDPRCYFDPTTHTWFAVILFINDANTASTIDLAVNSSGDPTRPWTVYHIDSTDDGSNGTPAHPGCPCFGDQPLLGIDGFNVYVSTNEFSILGPQFNGAQIYAFHKADLVSGRPVRFVHFDQLRIGVWAMTDRDAVAQGGIPILSSIVIRSEAYGVPPPAQQRGASSHLDSGDDRMQQVQLIGGELWGALGTSVTIPGDNAPRAGAAWFAVKPRLNGLLIGGARIQRQGYVTSRGNYLLYPAVQADARGSAAMAVTLSGVHHFPSAAYATLRSGDSAFRPVTIAAPGTGPYDPKATRWGDYSWTILDPARDTFWMATEYIPPPGSQTKDGRRNWGTRIMEVAAPS